MASINFRKNRNTFHSLIQIYWKSCQGPKALSRMPSVWPEPSLCWHSSDRWDRCKQRSWGSGGTQCGSAHHILTCARRYGRCRTWRPLRRLSQCSFWGPLDRTPQGKGLKNKAEHKARDIYFPYSSLTLSHVNFQSLPGVFDRIAFRTVVCEGVWIVLAFDVVSNIHNSLVGELQADTAGWYTTVIADHKFDEFLWAREIALKEKSKVNKGLLQSHLTFTGMVLQRLFWRKYLGTYGTIIGESIWKMLALDVVAHIGFCRVGEGVTDRTTGNSIFIQPYEAVEVLRLFYHSWKMKSSLLIVPWHRTLQ